MSKLIDRIVGMDKDNYVYGSWERNILSLFLCNLLGTDY